jgi:hypothetical protein
VRDGRSASVEVTADLLGAEGLRVEVDRASSIPDDEERGESGDVVGGHRATVVEARRRRKLPSSSGRQRRCGCPSYTTDAGVTYSSTVQSASGEVDPLTLHLDVVPALAHLGGVKVSPPFQTAPDGDPPRHVRISCRARKRLWFSVHRDRSATR